MAVSKVNIQDRYGRLVVLERTQERYRNYPIWKCMCDCGNEVLVNSGMLRSGNTRSCGCLRKETVSKRSWKGYEGISQSYWGNIQLGAKNRNLEFSVTIEEAWTVYISQDKRCVYSNLPIEFSSDLTTSAYGTASLDRKDSSQGYITNNIQWVHKDINRMKMDLSEDNFLNLCKLITENNTHDN